MTFEYDENKSRSNKLKHGIDFEEARELWVDPYAFEIPSLAGEEEERFLVLGQINSKNYIKTIQL